MLRAFSALLSIINTVLTLYREYKLREEGRRAVLTEQRQAAFKVKEIADAVRTDAIPSDKRDIISRL